MNDGTFARIACCRPVQHIDQFVLERGKFFLQGTFVRQLGIFPDERDDDLRGVGLIFKDVALHGATKEMLLRFLEMFELRKQARVLACSHLYMDVEAMHFRASTIDAPGRRISARATGWPGLKLRDGLTGYEIDATDHFRDQPFLAYILVDGIIRNAKFICRFSS